MQQQNLMGPGHFSGNQMGIPAGGSVYHQPNFMQMNFRNPSISVHSFGASTLSKNVRSESPRTLARKNSYWPGLEGIFPDFFFHVPFASLREF